MPRRGRYSTYPHTSKKPSGERIYDDIPPVHSHPVRADDALRERQKSWLRDALKTTGSITKIMETDITAPVITIEPDTAEHQTNHRVLTILEYATYIGDASFFKEVLAALHNLVPGRSRGFLMHLIETHQHEALATAIKMISPETIHDLCNKPAGDAFTPYLWAVYARNDIARQYLEDISNTHDATMGGDYPANAAMLAIEQDNQPATEHYIANSHFHSLYTDIPKGGLNVLSVAIRRRAFKSVALMLGTIKLPTEVFLNQHAKSGYETPLEEILKHDNRSLTSMMITSSPDDVAEHHQEILARALSERLGHMPSDAEIRTLCESDDDTPYGEAESASIKTLANSYALAALRILAPSSVEAMAKYMAIKDECISGIKALLSPPTEPSFISTGVAPLETMETVLTLNAQVHSLQSELADTKALIAQRTLEVEESMEKLTEAKKEIARLLERSKPQASVGPLKTRIKTLEAQIEELEKAAEDAKTRTSNQKRSLRDKETALLSSKKQCNRLEGKLERKEAQLENLRATMSAELTAKDAKIESLETALALQEATAEAEFTPLQDKLAETEEALNASTRRQKELEDLLTAARVSKEALIEKHREEIASIKHGHTAEISKLASQLSQKMTEIRQLQIMYYHGGMPTYSTPPLPPTPPSRPVTPASPPTSMSPAPSRSGHYAHAFRSVDPSEMTRTSYLKPA